MLVYSGIKYGHYCNPINKVTIKYRHVKDIEFIPFHFKVSGIKILKESAADIFI